MRMVSRSPRLRTWLCSLALLGGLALPLATAKADAPTTAPATEPTTQPAATPTPGPDPLGLTGGPTAPLTTPTYYLAGVPDGSIDKNGGTFKPWPGDKPTAEDAAKMAVNTTYHLNFVWTLLAGFLVMFMQAGFALVETGLCRAKNAAHTMTMNFLVYPLGMLAFFACGFAFMCGGANKSPIGGPGGLGGVPQMNSGIMVGATADDPGWLILGTKGFFLTGDAYDGGALVWFLFMMVFMDTTATIPTGALAERWNTRSFVVFSLFIGGLIYPIYGGWVWGGGWLAQMGYKWHLGHGAVDYAGSGVVHLQGGALALITSWLLGPRIGKYDANGKPKPILGHNIPMVLLGTFILAFGWFGFNAGSSMAGSDGRIGVTAVNTMLAGSAAAFTGVLYMWLIHPGKKPDPTMACNSMLAGLVAITAPCAFVTPVSAVIIGGIAGVIVIWCVFFIEKIGIDDPVGAISVHGLNGAWGLIAVGLFADGTYGAGLNNVDGHDYMGVVGRGVTGLFYGDSKQLVAQLIDVGVCVAWNVVVGGIIFFVIGKVFGTNRVPPEVEIAGLDIPEMGAPAYPEYLTTMAPEEVSAAELAEARKVKGVPAMA